MTSTDQTETYAVKDYNMPKVDERLAQLNRRATKLGLPPLSYTVVTTEDRPIYKHTYLGSEKVGVQRWHNLRIDGEAPQWSDYTFVATLQHTPDGTVIRNVPNMSIELDLSGYRNAEPTCDHCKLRRQRNDTFLVYHNTQHTLQQVGRNCLQDFMGAGADLQAKAAELLTLFHEFVRADGEDSGYMPGSRGDKLIPLDYYLSYVAGTIRLHGWVSATTARNSDDPTVQATKNIAAEYMYQDERCNASPCRNREHDHLERTDADALLADRAVAWCESLAERYDTDPQAASDFDHNMVVATRSQVVTQRTLGIAAYAVQAVLKQDMKDAERTAEQRTTRINDWLPNATIGQRIKNLKATVTGAMTSEGDFGLSVLYTFLTDTGHAVKWWSSNDLDLAPGTKVTVAGTVKRLETYTPRDSDKVYKNTLLTRCKVEVQE